LYILKVFDDQPVIDELRLVYALQYCVDVLRPDIVHMSNGISYCEYLPLFKQVCSKAYQNGIIVVAAHDNFGTLSYPASLKGVIGVDVSDELKKGYVFLERDDVNIVVPNKTHRVPWLNNGFFTSNGTSFNACTVTSMVASILATGDHTYEQVMAELKKNSSQSISYPVKESHCLGSTLGFSLPQKAVLFPFNKEMHSLIRFQSMLPFEIAGMYDVRYLRQVGKYPEDIIGIERFKKSMPIVSYEHIDWEASFDTFVMGHTSVLERSIGVNYARETAENCLRYGKNLVSLSYFPEWERYDTLFKENGLSLYMPRVTVDDVPSLYEGKLRCIGVPIIGIFGTSSRQGKFSLQLNLREYFMQAGWKVGQLGTEPTSLLFGFDEVYPIGYESTVEISGYESIAAVNNMIGRIEDKNPDIIIVGGQSQTIPQQTGNLRLYVLEQHEFLMATEPDAVVLCVNLFDDNEYIERTIAYIEAIANACVIALVLFPKDRAVVGGVLTNQLKAAAPERVMARKEEMMHEFHRPVFILGEGVEDLGDLCVRHFTGGACEK
jgi:uncharacterized NAD-dependent epimerase/dehydratase family protein